MIDDLHFIQVLIELLLKSSSPSHSPFHYQPLISFFTISVAFQCTVKESSYEKHVLMIACIIMNAYEI